MQPISTIDLPLKHLQSGKVREIFDLGDDFILMVTTDRLSAFDVILPDPIPFRGVVLNQMSLYWYRWFRGLVNHTILLTDPGLMGLGDLIPEKKLDALQGRSVLMKRAEVFPVECIVRGYLAGSGYKDYKRTGEICGHRLPKGLKKAEKLPQPIFTPSTKAVSGHDENISMKVAAKLVGKKTIEKLRDLSLEIYHRAALLAAKRGIIIADTKLEFGLLDNEIVLVDEVLTPDSSRFWPASRVVPGREPPSYDKQIVRNWLAKQDWDKTPPAPRLPMRTIKRTSDAYVEIYERLTGQVLDI